MRGHRSQRAGAGHLRVLATALFLCLWHEAAALQLSRIPDLTTSENTPTLAVPLTISSRYSDREVALLVKSSNPLLVPESNVVFGSRGFGTAGRSLVVTPAANQCGQAILEVEATDGVETVTQSFSVTVTSVNDAPTLSRIAHQAITEANPAATVAFTVGDVETPAASLMVTASSSDASLLRPSAISLAGTGATRNISLRRAAGKSGTASVTITVNDGEAAASQTFNVCIGTINLPPVANAGLDQTLVATNTALLSGTATDDSSNGQRLLAVWSVISGGAGVEFVNPAALNTAVRFPRAGVYTLRLTASDGELSGSDDMTVIVAAKSIAAIQAKGLERR